MKRIYLDNAATSKVDKSVLKFMIPYFLEDYGNASSLHKIGRIARNAVEESRKKIADFLGCSASEIIFTSGGTESDVLAIRGLAKNHSNKKKHIITSRIEHPAVLQTCKSLEDEGFRVDYVPVNSVGVVNIDDIKKLICNDTFLVSIMHVNNEVGSIQPIAEIGELCHSKGIVFHTDAVQSFCKVKIPLESIDLLSVSAHKINGPKGVGFLYVRKGLKLSPVNTGGGHEFGLRSGTENVPGIVGLSRAVEVWGGVSKKRIMESRDYLITELLKIPGSKLNGPGIASGLRVISNVNISFSGVEGDALLIILDNKGICVSTGSACSSKSSKGSHVLKALGVDTNNSGNLRISLGIDNTLKECKNVVVAIKEAVEKLRLSTNRGKLLNNSLVIDGDYSINEVLKLIPDSEGVFLKHGIMVSDCIMPLDSSIKVVCKAKNINTKVLLEEINKKIKK
ncbi:cysteine desulfurase NifS [Candidatus Pacearchaeota archaeon CG10_big_fil_rev_8_21_14_0_10_35_13]|nr:MAG: cysteine desulfurase NifS [Candidatus Pacearchaeota archaeon CG10_big_fil_rev_8_21_14_0_10_35_13]